MPQEDPTRTVQLILAYQAGDERAMEELLDRYYPRVRRIIRVRFGRLPRGQAADDIVQETMLAAVRGLDRFEPRDDADFIDWLARIALNKIRDCDERLRALKRCEERAQSLERLREGSGSSTGFDPARETRGVVERLMAQENEDLVDACLSCLEHTERELILLRDYAGATWSDIAGRLALDSGDAARKRHRRARLSLTREVRRVLEREGSAS